MKESLLADELDGCLKFFEIFGLQFFSLKSVFEKNSRQWAIFQIAHLIVFCAICFLLGFSIIYASVFSDKVTTENVLTVVAVTATCFTAYSQFHDPRQFDLVIGITIINFLSIIAYRFSFFVSFVNLQLHQIEENFCTVFQAKPPPTYEKVYRIEVTEKPKKDELHQLTTLWVIYIKVCENASKCVHPGAKSCN